MSNTNTLKIYEKKIKSGKESYRYFFIRKELQPLFRDLGKFTLLCSDGTKYYNLEICISGIAERFFIFANDFFLEHPFLQKNESLEFSIDKDHRILRVYINTTDSQVMPNIGDNCSQAENTEYNIQLNDIDSSQIDCEVFWKTIDYIKDSFDKFEWYYRVYEANVRAELIDPILKIIGWTPPYIRREENNVDYLLYGNDYFNMGSPKMVIEVKKYREQLRTSGGKKTPIEYKQEKQLKEYCNRENIKALAGLLTNGIRWCLYLKDNNYEYQGEINIIHTPKDKIYKFFQALSRPVFDKINQIDWSWIENFKREEKRPFQISINNSPIKNQKEAVRIIGEKFIDKCYEIRKDPFFYCFSDSIVLNNQQTGYEEDYENHAGDKFFINHYRGIYEQIILLQEINSKLDLGFTIKLNQA